MSWLYSIGIGKRNRDYDAGKGVTQLDRPVISIGNLSTGGTGKTPMVHLIVSLLQEQGHHPVIAMRGYGARPGEKGDEQLEHEQALPGVPIVAQPDRIAGLSAFFASEAGRGVDRVVLDDGFQHRKIARDLDIVLIDATRPPDRDALLPKGHLREPIGSLQRAGIVVLTHAERVDADEINRLRSLVGGYTQAHVLVASHVWSVIHQYTRSGSAWEHASVSPDDLRSQRVYAASAIGNPGAFLDMAKSHSLHIVHHHMMADHASFSESQAQAWSKAQEGQHSVSLLLTRKDWVKASKLESWNDGDRVIVPELSIKFESDEALRRAVQDV